MRAQIGLLLPEENLGVVILSNMNENHAPTAIMYCVFDSFWVMPTNKWISGQSI